MMSRPTSESTAADERPTGPTVGEVRARTMALREELLPTLRAMIERRLSPRHRRRADVDDVLNEAFIRLDRSLSVKAPESEAMCRAWVFRSTLNAWQDQKRRNTAKRRDVSEEAPLPVGSIEMLLSGIGVATACGLKETVDRIRESIKPSEFEVVWMRSVDGLSFGEIADIVGKPEGTVAKCHHRALEKIRTAIPSPFTSSP